MKNLPKSLIDSAAKLHAKSDGDCQMCAEAEHITQFSSREMVEGLPWMKSNNIPPCLWSYGYHMTTYWDSTDVWQLELMEEKAKCEIEQTGVNEYTLDRIITQIQNGTFKDFPLNVFGLDTETDLFQTEYYLEHYGIDFTDMNMILATQCLWLFLLSEHFMDRIDSIARLKEAELARKQKIKSTNHDDRSIEELLASFSKTNVKNSGKVTKKMKKTKKVPQATSRPKISKVRPTKKVKKVDDDVSVKQNKYNKRFTKTKKPAKL